MPWHPHNLTEDSGALTVNGPLISHVVAAERTQHVFYRGLGDGPQLVEVWWRPNEKPQWGLPGTGTGVDLSVAGGWLASHVVESEGTQHVFVVDGARQVHPSELWWRGWDLVRAADLCTQAGQPLLAGSTLASHVFVEEGTQHVFTAALGQIDGADVFGHVCEFFGAAGSPRRWWT